MSMTEDEFRKAIRPLVKEFPTHERQLAFTAIWLTARSSIPSKRLGELAREVLHDVNPLDGADPESSRLH